MAGNDTCHQYKMYSSELNSMMREVLHDLCDVDFQHEVEIINLTASDADRETKEYMRSKLVDAHQEKRQPFVDLLNDLRRQQHRQSFTV